MTSTYLLQSAVTLLAVCALAVALLFGARRVGVGRSFGPLQVRAHLPLEARRAVYLISVGNRVLVVGSSEAGMVKLADLPASDVPEVIPPKARSFADVLASLTGKNSGAVTPTQPSIAVAPAVDTPSDETSDHS